MRIAIDSTQSRLAVLEGESLVFYNVTGGSARPADGVAAAKGQWLTACDDCVAVLAGDISPGLASVEDAKVLRFRWDGTELPPLGVGEVDRRGLSLSADGSRLVVTDWTSCRVTLWDANAGAKLGAAGKSIPSGAAISPDGTRIICGTADQGTGAILLFEPNGGTLAMSVLKAPKPSPGLDDAPYASVWSSDGRLAAISNQTWGGRGLFVYDGVAGQPLWSVAADEGEELEPEEWFPMPIVFGGELLFAGEAGGVRAYRASDGEDLGLLALDFDPRAGFAVQASARRLWLSGAQSVDFAEGWS